MSNLVKWLLGIGAVAVIGGGGYAIVESQNHADKKTESSVSGHKKASSHKRASEKSSSKTSSSSSEVSSSEAPASSSEQPASSEQAVSTETSEAAATTQADQSVVGNPQGEVQADPNTYVTTPGAATSAVAAHMSQVQGRDPNRFTLSAHPSDGGVGYTVNVSSSQIAGTLAVYQVSANGVVTQVQ